MVLWSAPWRRCAQNTCERCAPPPRSTRCWGVVQGAGRARIASTAAFELRDAMHRALKPRQLRAGDEFEAAVVALCGLSAPSPPRVSALPAAPPALLVQRPAAAMSLSFDQSGSGAVAVGPLSLTEVQQLACDCGFAKGGVAPSKPLALRADMPSFFKALGVTSLSAFRELFYNSRVPQPKPGQAPPPPPPKKQVATAAPAVRTSRACRLPERITAHLLAHRRNRLAQRRTPCPTSRSTLAWRGRSRA